ncbi:flagellar basal body P-ring protein FlgI [Thermodesulforhabdus norvegica]|uniref:Flagellar P-ring protein n=1 Tax=Thermodesulforhabdus norvegica TaxID=39841 RepID=A0A1I4R4Z5_9BACT|nr:flagellar basal body P-ring protein FlgI [Thermodesulforhabdus norvegica]SFM47215.1 flagellar P-ring protein precursor FlgI [Thermodesulforhabdus norvegica]
MSRLLSLILVTAFLVMAELSSGARIKDIAYFVGNRPNLLIGYGLVVGLNGTGDKDKTEFTVSTLANLLDNMGINVDPEQVKVKNVAAVMVTARLPAFARVGSKIDVQVSSIGDAKSLAGGTLLMTPLQGPDGEIYAVAQGPVTIGGFAAGGAAAQVQQNHPTVGYIANGAIVEKEVPVDYSGLNRLDLIIRDPDFTTAYHISEAINVVFGNGTASPKDAGTVTVSIPPKWASNIVGFISKVESLEVIPDYIAKVVINERTGTIVMGENVRISPVAVAHGNLTVSITERPYVSQPLPFAPGETVVVPRTEVEVKEEKAHLAVVGGGVTIGQVVEGLNALGATPRDLINILQAIKAAGALHADLEIM